MFFVTESLLDDPSCHDIRMWFREEFPDGTSAEQMCRALPAQCHDKWLAQLLALDCDLTIELLALGASANTEGPAGWTALRHAAGEDLMDVASILIAEGARVDAFTAAGLGLTDVLRHILEKNRTVLNSRDCSGYTPLHWAIWKHQEGSLRMLVSAGADVNDPSTKSGQPLGMAALESWEDAVRLLLAAGANVNVRDYTGLSPLDYAAIEDNTAIANTLIEAGADVNAVNQLGETALHQAAGAGSLDAVRLLIGSGAAINVRSKAGRTPLREAVDPNGHFPEAFQEEKTGGPVEPIRKGPGDLPALLRLIKAQTVDEDRLAEMIELLRQHGGTE